MLIYDPSQDPYHSAVRILAILRANPQGMPTDTVRIADFYLAYPSALEDFRFPSQFRKMRTLAKKYQTPYRRPALGWVTFERMRPIFIAAVSGLVAAKYVTAEAVKVGRLIPLLQNVPADLNKACGSYLERYSGIRSFISAELASLPLLGNEGLKARSNLLEHRYDPV